MNNEISNILKLKGIDLFNLPLKSQYRVINFSGTADGTVLTPRFNILDFNNKYLIIKSFRCVPYYASEAIDFLFSDATSETIPAGDRINRIFDNFTTGASFRMQINEANIQMFEPFGNEQYNLDLFLDNIYYLYPEKLQSLNCYCNARIDSDLGGTLASPYVKIILEIYLI
jgi:hypothetical protein